MISKRYRKKLRAYIEMDNLHKFKSYCKKHAVDIAGILTENHETVLHIACSYGAERIIG